jgi:hypothetical protein
VGREKNANLFLAIFQNYVHTVQLPCVGASLFFYYLDVYSLLDVLTVVTSSKNLPSAVTMSDMIVAHREPLILETLRSSSLFAPQFIANSMIRKYFLLGMGITSYSR